MAKGSITAEVKAIVSTYRTCDQSLKTATSDNDDVKRKIDGNDKAWKIFDKACSSGLADKLQKFPKLDSGKQKAGLQDLRKLVADYQSRFKTLEKSTNLEGIAMVIDPAGMQGLEKALGNIGTKLDDAEKAKDDAAKKKAADEVAASGKRWSAQKQAIEKVFESNKSSQLKKVSGKDLEPFEKALASFKKLVTGTELSQMVSLYNSAPDDPETKKTCAEIVGKIENSCDAAYKCLKMGLVDAREALESLITNDLKTLQKAFA